MKAICKKLFGYCYRCRRWFVYPKRRRMSTMYENDKDNFIKVCKDCFDEVEDYWEERWAEYNSSRL